jgi:hypothetical protein
MNRVIPMAAGILALVAGAYQAWFTLHVLHTASTYSDSLKGLEFYTTSFHSFVVWLNAEAVASAVAALVLILGGAMVLAGKSLGRGFIIVGCVLTVAHTGVGWMIATNMLHWFADIGANEYGFLWFDIPSRLAIVLLALAVPVITVILVLLPATRQWCRGSLTGAPATETGTPQADPAQPAETD